MLSQESISEHIIYSENKVMNVLTQYMPEDQYYPPGVDVNLYLYGSTNFIWNPKCCDKIEGDSAITTDRVY